MSDHDAVIGSEDATISPVEGTKAEAEIFRPISTIATLQVIESVLLVLAAFYIGRAIILPVLLAILLKLLLQPAVRRLEKWLLPRGLAAALTIASVIFVVVSTFTALSGTAVQWAGKLQDGLPRLKDRLILISTPVLQLDKFLRDAEAWVHPGGGAVASGTAAGLPEMVLSGTANFAGGLIATIIVLYFLLISGDIFLRRLVEILPRFRDKKAAVRISQEIETNISAYLVTITGMNAAVGGVTVMLTWAAGLDNPPLWGVIAFLLNYIPMIGPAACLGILLLAGLVTLDSLVMALTPAAGFLIVHMIEGQFVTPLLVARRFTLNPVVVIVSLIFWYWLWGVAGAILAVPTLGIIKIICDGIRPWAAFGHLIEG